MSPAYFIRRPRFAIVIAILTVLVGLLSLVVMPVDQYPDISAPKVVVRANYPGASAEDVEDAVCRPIEDALDRIGAHPESVLSRRVRLGRFGRYGVIVSGLMGRPFMTSPVTSVFFS